MKEETPGKVSLHHQFPSFCPDPEVLLVVPEAQQAEANPSNILYHAELFKLE